MHPFTYLRASDPQTASAAAAQGAEFIAGGTDMLQLMKDHVRQPEKLIDLNALPWRGIGAERSYPVISEALLASASPQVRNMASIGGNLLQRTRCFYFRDTAMPCNKRAPGSGCSAIGGENRMHAVLGGSEHCVATHASDLAVALAALDALVVIAGPYGERRVALIDFHLLPGDTPERENVLAPGEMIAAVEVPALSFAARSRYRKIRDRASFEFALASAAVALDVEGGTIRDARIALGGIGTKPWRAPGAEAALKGVPANVDSFAAAAQAALQDATPLAQNGFKIELARRTLTRTLADTAQIRS